MRAHVFWTTTKPIYAQLDLLLRATIHVFMTGCLFRGFPTLRIADAFLINIKCQSTQRSKVEKKRKGEFTHTHIKCLALMVQHVLLPELPQRSASGPFIKTMSVVVLGCFSFDLLVKKLKFYGLFFRFFLSFPSGRNVQQVKAYRFAAIVSPEQGCTSLDNLLARHFGRVHHRLLTLINYASCSGQQLSTAKQSFG